MINTKGFVTIISLLVMVIILISTLLLIHTSNLEYLVVNSTINNVQSYYMVEGKIDLLLYNEKYYYNEIFPRIETYIKYNRLSPFYNRKILLDREDLLEGDNNIVTIDFFNDNGKMIMELEASDKYRGISNKLISKITILNEFFEMALPIISKDYITEDKISDYERYTDYLQREIKIPATNSDIIGVEAINYEEIVLKKDLNNRISIEHYRNNIENPIKKEIITNNRLFLLVKNNSLVPTTLSIKSEDNLEKITIEGVLYIEGDLEIYCNIDFSGVLIVNKGKFYIDPSVEAKFQGEVFLIDSIEEIEYNDKIHISYSLRDIRKYGIYLPKFIDPKVQLIKVK